MLIGSLQGRNTGVKAIFGGSVKKPLMTKVSMRHLNEIVRERNQYSRDAMEAWQDFINLKSRMDTELTKVSKLNNFLVEELESWKQQFLKFQAFAEQLTKETQELKVKIEGHKRENRRLTGLIDQQKDDSARLTVRLSGTEKQRDDALEALVLQQEIAEELERERKRNKKEISAMQHATHALTRQRDEAQRVVLHLRALIDGQAHHMEHIVKSLADNPDLSEYIGEGFGDEAEDVENASEKAISKDLPETSTEGIGGIDREQTRSYSRASTVDLGLEGEDVSPDMETRLLDNPVSRKRLSQLSMSDVADRHLRDKTDAIAYIIRNISEQCAAAVDGLQLAQRADSDAGDHHERKTNRLVPSEDGHDLSSASHGSENGEEGSISYLHPRRDSSVPPTPDLVHNRSSTSMSMASASTTPERNSLQAYKSEHVPEVPTRILESGLDHDVGDDSIHVESPATKYAHTVRRRESRRLDGFIANSPS